MIFKRFLITLLFLMAVGSSQATSRDSLIVRAGADGWDLVHRILPGETIFSIARRFSVPPAILAEVNGLSYQDGLVKASLITIPLGTYNMLSTPPLSPDSAKPIYYRFLAGDKLSHISRMGSVSQQSLAQWNSLIPGSLPVGKVLLVGWVRCAPQSMIAISPVPPFMPKDTTPKYLFQPADTTIGPSKADIPLTLKQLWHEQTLDGQNVVTEKGSAGFFSINIRSPRAAEYAFHNAAARGTVIRVRNMNNGRTIYVKVLGPLPDAKQYAGCILGLSNGAKAALGVQETKAFCELSYAGY